VVPIVELTISGLSCIENPYTSQKKLPIEKIVNIESEMLSADFNFQILYACGKYPKDIHVPNIVVMIAILLIH
jgi:hypothetical protein